MGSLNETPQRPSGLTVIQAKLSSEKRGDEVIPNSQRQVVCCLASHILLLGACIASVKEMARIRTSALEAEGLVFPDREVSQGSPLAPPSQACATSLITPALKGDSTLRCFQVLCDLKMFKCQSWPLVPIALKSYN